jgi:hypothetical protein
MRGLLALVIVLGVVMVAMAGTLVVGLVHKIGGRGSQVDAAVAASLVLDEPAGTHILAISPAGDRLAVLLQGGGPDRVLFVDPARDRVAGRLALRQ